MDTVSKRKKIGLALSGGAARGIAHVGVLRVLAKEKIPIDFIAGTSAGAIVGAAYASHRDTDRLTEDALAANWTKMAGLIDPLLSKSGIIKGKKILSLISAFIGGNIDFTDLKIPFSCVATDIDTGEEVVINQGHVPEALRASISLPGIFAVVKRNERYLVDGGLTSPVPVGVVRRMGADIVIAVNVNPGVTMRMGKAYKQRMDAHKEPNLIQVMTQSFYITSYTVGQHAMENADIIIEPDLAHVGAADFSKAPELITRGMEAAEKAMHKIRKMLADL